MGGIGKSELALQYALAYQDEYPGSLCWFSVRGENIGTQIIEYAASYLNIFAPDELESDRAKVNHCWQEWRDGKSLIVLDDVPDYGKYYEENVAPYLPTATNKIKVLMTSRERPVEIPRLDLDVLTEDAALELIARLAGGERIACDLERKRDYPSELCEWLGYLPLGLQLVGRYLKRKTTLNITEMLQRLEKQKLTARALLKPKQADMMAQLGVAAAFELSWDELNAEAQELGCYLSLFGSEPFKWSWVEDVGIQSTDEDEREEEIEAWEELRDEELVDRNLLKVTINRDSQSSTEPQYQLHALIAEYFRAKLEASEGVEVMKQNFCWQMMEIARSISQTPIQEDIRRVALAIPHLSMVVTELIDYVDAENLIWLYWGLGGFYRLV